MSEAKPVRVEVESLSVELKEVLNQEVLVTVLYTPTGAITKRKVPLKHVYKYTTVAVAKFRDTINEHAPDHDFYVIVLNEGDTNVFRYETKA